MHPCFRLSACFLLLFCLWTPETVAQSVRTKVPKQRVNVFRARIKAGFSVNAKGAANYTIPLDLPPGTAGCAPVISILYSSQSGNGLLGMGFNLSGLSAIQRTGASLAEDGFTGGINYDSSDRFTVDGNRLMRTDPGATAYTSPGAVYMTELQTWSKYQTQGVMGQGPASFTVLQKDGSVQVYGDPLNAAVPARGPVFDSGAKAGSIRTWLLAGISDPYGNTIRYTYSFAPTTLNGQLLQGSANNSTAYPDAIYYTGNKNLGTPEKRKVQFYYEPRTDTILRYSGGAAVSIYLRLKAIRTFVVIRQDTVPISTYLLNYDSSSPQGVSRLSSLCRIGTKGGQAAPLSFTWTDGGNTLVPAGNTWTGPGSPQGGMVADCNRDGKTDIIPILDNAITAIYFSTGSGFRQQPLASPLLVSKTSFLGDYNGDGLPDMLVASGLSGRLYYGNGQGFATGFTPINNMQVNSNCSNCTWVADYNGDGRSDVLSVTGTSGYLSFGDSVGLGSPILLPNLSLTTGQIWVADFNADGQADLYSGSTTGGSLYLSDFSRSGNWQPVIDVPPMNIASTPSNNLIADINADGLADILTHVGIQYNLYLSTGNGFDPARSYNALNLDGNQNWLSDFNGDGCMDFYTLIGDSATIYYFYGTQFTTVQTASPALLNTWTWSGDFNGDGIADLYAANTASMYFGGGTKGLPIGNSNQVPHLLKHINNGIQGTIGIHYRPMSDTLVYQPAALVPGGTMESLSTQNNFSAFPLSPVQVSLYPFIQAQSSLYLVADDHFSDGMGNRYAYQYRYNGSLNDLDGYGWLGFAMSCRRDSAANNIFTQQYAQLVPLTGKVLTSLKTDLNNVPLRCNRNSYGITVNNVYGGSPIYQVNTSLVRNDYYENGLFAFTTGSNNMYDAFGNVIRYTNLNDTAEPARTIYTNARYINDTVNWHIGFLQSSRQSPDSSGFLPLNQDSVIYDTATYAVVQEQHWLNTDSSWLLHHYHYDHYGNRDWRVNESGDTTHIHFDSVYHSFEEKIVSPPNSQQKRLIAHAHFDPAFGKMTAARDVNGNLYTVVPDQFGQDSLLTGPAPDGSQVILSKLLYSASDSSSFRLQTITRVDWAGHKWDTVLSVYDGLDREVRLQWYGSKQQPITCIREYNSNNLEVRSSLPAYKKDTLQWITKTYDPNQRILTLQFPASTQKMVTNQYQYSSKQVILQEAVGTSDLRNSSWEMDYFNGISRMVSYTDANGLSIQYNYDLLARLTTATDPGNLTTTTSYNSLNDIIASYNPSAGNNTILYNYIGRTSTQIRQSGDSIRSIYDALKRKIQAISSSDTYTYVYDLAGSPNGNNNLCTVGVGDSSWSYTFGYDAYGQRTTANLHIDGRDHVQRFWYNPNGKLRRLVQPDSSTELYHYYTNGFLQSITKQQAGQTQKPPLMAVQFLDFDAAGNTTLTRYGNGLQKRASFYPLSLLKEYSIASPSGMVLSSLAYRWNALTQLTAIKDRLKPGQDQSFHFQPNGRLDTARGPYGLLTYAYDPAGNLVQKDSIFYKYNNYQVLAGSRNNQRLFAANYDSNGNLSQRTTYSGTDSTNRQYLFDTRNRLIAIVSGKDTLYQFAYNQAGQRLMQTDVRKGITTWYIAPGYEVTRTPSASLQTSYVMAQAQRMVAVTRASDPMAGRRYSHSGIPTLGTQYYHEDLINNNRLSTDAAGKARYKALYKPYGETYEATGTDKPRYRFGGQELDESGLYYFNARYYDPVTGRFISADDRPGGPQNRHDVHNRYAYTLNNPVQYTDPSGHSLSNLVINVLLGIADIATEGALTEVEAEVVARGGEMRARMEVGENFYRGLKMSCSQHMNEIDREVFTDAYRVQREFVANRPIELTRPDIYRNIGRNALNVPFFSNREFDELATEIADRNAKLQQPGTYWFQNDREIGNALRWGRPFKFTLSTRDLQLRIGSKAISHAALEGEEGAAVYTAGYVRYDLEKETLFLSRQSGHYMTTVPSLLMSIPYWNMIKIGSRLNYTSIRLIEAIE